MIILAEDDADQRVPLRLALQLAGYTVREAPTGEAALALQRERPSPFLVTDVFMPETDGFELIDAFRKEFPHTRIIVMSGGGQRAKRDCLESARLIGVDATLQKPFEIKMLLETLRELGR